MELHNWKISYNFICNKKLCIEGLRLFQSLYASSIYCLNKNEKSSYLSPNIISVYFFIVLFNELQSDQYNIKIVHLTEEIIYKTVNYSKSYLRI